MFKCQQFHAYLNFFNTSKPDSEFLKSHTQLSRKIIKLINVKMPTIVGILTFISIINATSESLKARKMCIFSTL